MKSKHIITFLVVAAIAVAVYYFIIKEEAAPVVNENPPANSPIAPPAAPVDNSPLKSGNLVYAITDKVNIRLADNDFGNVYSTVAKGKFVGAYWRNASNGYIEIKIAANAKPIYVKRTEVYLGQK